MDYLALSKWIAFKITTLNGRFDGLKSVADAQIVYQEDGGNASNIFQSGINEKNQTLVEKLQGAEFSYTMKDISENRNFRC